MGPRTGLNPYPQIGVYWAYSLRGLIALNLNALNLARRCYLILFCAWLVLSSGCVGRPGQLGWIMHSRYWDPKITLVDINQDGTQDIVLSGYQKKERKDDRDKVITDSVVALDGRNHKMLWGY